MAKTHAAPSSDILEAALLGLESQREQLDAKIAHVRSLLGRKVGRPAKVAAAPSVLEVVSNGVTTRRELSPEARKRIAAAQKKRWAAFRKSKK